MGGLFGHKGSDTVTDEKRGRFYKIAYDSVFHSSVCRVEGGILCCCASNGVAGMRSLGYTSVPGG